MGLAARWRGRDDVHLLIKTGPAALEDTRRRLLGTPAVAVPYLDRMDLAYAAADLVVCRAGSATVAEPRHHEGARGPRALSASRPATTRPTTPGCGPTQERAAARRRDTTAEALAALAEPPARRSGATPPPCRQRRPQDCARQGGRSPGPPRHRTRRNTEGVAVLMNATSSWADRTVLVTGAEGFIGSTLVDLLLAEGADVRAFVHYKPYAEKGHLAHLLDDPRVQLLAGDVRDPGRVSGRRRGLRHGLPPRGADRHPVLVRLTGRVRPDERRRNGERGGGLGRRHAVRRMVHTSHEVYGTARTAPIDESHLAAAAVPYSASKIGAT